MRQRAAQTKWRKLLWKHPRSIIQISDILLAKVPANTPEGKAELSEALNHPAFNRSACTRIGIAVVTIDGQMYWTCSVYS